MITKGILMGIGPVLEVGSYPTIKKRHILIQTFEQYPQLLIFDLLQHNTKLIDEVNLRATIDVHFVIRGRIWKRDRDKLVYINDFICFKIEEKSPVLDVGAKNYL